jgi:5-methylcytosine-specific restriction endonuclease McrA
MSHPRRASPLQRALLYVLAGRKCVLCGAPLTGSFHADHVQPFAQGGDTRLYNLRALCPTCNLTRKYSRP